MTHPLSALLSHDIDNNPHETLHHTDNHTASNERRLVNLQPARNSSTLPDDPDLKIEPDTAHTKLATTHQKYTNLRAHYTTTVPKAVAAS